jgi:hypothetical protein
MFRSRRFTAPNRWTGSLLGITLLGVTGLLAAERRAKQPDWSQQSVSEVFFDDAFTEALVGPRPAHLAPNATSSPTSQVAGPNQAPAPADPSAGNASDQNWSQVIDAETIEDEVKRIGQQLDQIVTTPVSFAGQGYQDARREFSMLAVLFGVIHEYQDTVRWRDDAPAARERFAHIASIAKVGTIQVYQAAKNGKQDLQDMVRGETLSDRTYDRDKKWGELVDRAPLMQRMELDFRDHIVPWTASAAEFQKNREALVQRARLLGMLAHVLTGEAMEDADDETYAGYCQQIETASRAIVEAIEANNYEAARSATSDISKSCDNCHEAYRG